MSLLFLVRHGQASAGTHDYDRLSEIGRQQSRLLGQWWKEHNFKPDSVYHGSLTRQRDTAISALDALGLSAEKIACTTHDGLNEYNHRTIESYFAHDSADDTPESMTFDDYLAIMQRWRDHEPTQREAQPIEAFETWDEFMARGWNTIRTIHQNNESRGQNVFFTSGGVIASIVSTVLNLDFAHTIDAIWRIRNSSVTTLHFDGEKARLVEFNTIPHLQTKYDRSLITLI